MSNPLISAVDLTGVLADVTVLDVRYRMGAQAGPPQYAAGHVPGASYVDLDTDLADPPGEGRHPLPSTVRFERAMRRAGVRNSRPVVVYDDWQGRAAARCWWLLRWAGHRDVRVLDGGWSAWLAQGAPTRVGHDPGHDAGHDGDFTVSSGVMPTVDSAALRTGGAGLVLDARAPERYRGDTEPVDPVAGHIPGAVNVPTEANLDEQGLFRSPDELRGVYGAVGAAPAGQVAVYCGSGVTACHDVLALATIGVRAALYPGSWSAWVGDPDNPVATG